MSVFFLAMALLVYFPLWVWMSLWFVYIYHLSVILCFQVTWFKCQRHQTLIYSVKLHELYSGLRYIIFARASSYLLTINMPWYTHLDTLASSYMKMRRYCNSQPQIKWRRSWTTIYHRAAFNTEKNPYHKASVNKIPNNNWKHFKRDNVRLDVYIK